MESIKEGMKFNEHNPAGTWEDLTYFCGMIHRFLVSTWDSPAFCAGLALLEKWHSKSMNLFYNARPPSIVKI